ncbi:MAG: hypothetical protein HDS68_06540, partial [Bacteroidales bacterium]|nr:hypothetical protein [Bacteroidales bacterium]
MKHALFIVFTLFIGLTSCIQDELSTKDSVEYLSKEYCGNDTEGITQETALETYEKLLEKFADSKSRGNGETDYPTWFGGAYVNSDSQLVVKTTEPDIYELSTLKDIEISLCKYSLNDFNKITNLITQLANAGDKFILDNIIMYGEDIQSNTYVIGLRNNT